MMTGKRLLVLGAAAIAATAAGLGPPSDTGPRPPALASIATCGRVSDTHYSFRVIAHGDHAPSCRTARRMARRTVGSQVDRPLYVRGWRCTADYYYEGPWSFLCIRGRTQGQVSIDRFREL
jgi:hypothetical protein